MSATPTPAAGVDWTDPCARADALRGAYYDLLSGARETEVRTRTLDAEELVKFQTVDLDRLKAALASAETECAAAKAGRPLDANRRFAISGRFKASWPPGYRPDPRDPFSVL